MYLNLCWPNLFQASGETKCISISVDQTHRILARTENASQLVLTKPTYASLDTKCFSTCANQTHPVPARTPNVSQHVLTKAIPWKVRKRNLSLLVLTQPNHCYRGLKMRLYMYCTYFYHASEHKLHLNKCWETPAMPARTQNAPQHMLTNQSHARENKKRISTCVDQNHSFNVGKQMDFNQWWPKQSHTSDVKKCISSCVVQPIKSSEYTKCFSTHDEQNHLMPARTLKTCVDQTSRARWTTYASQHVLSKPTYASQCTKCFSTSANKLIQWQQGIKMYLNLCWQNPSYASQDTKCTSTSVDQTYPIPACRKRYLNMC